MRPTARFVPWATYFLLAAIVAVYLVEIATGRAGNETALLGLGAIPNSGRLDGEYWRLLSYSFLHLNWNHLLMNSVLLWWTGRIVERRTGASQTLSLYFASVLVAAATILVLRQLHPKEGASLGASGGVFGLLTAALLLVYRGDAVARFGKNPRMRVGLWIAMAISLYITFQPGVSIAGHAAGLATGLLLGMLIRLRRDPEPAQAPA